MRALALVLTASIAAAVEAPMLIPLGSAELQVAPGAAASAPLAQERHQNGLLTLRAGQQQHDPLDIVVLVRVTGGPVTVSVRPAGAGGAPLASALVPVGDGILRLPAGAPTDLVLDGACETAPAQVSAIAYGDFLQPGIMQALGGAEAAPDNEAAAERDPALRPFVAEAGILKQLATAMIAHVGESERWPMVAVEGIPVPPQTPEQARLITAASLELLARRMQLPPKMFMSAEHAAAVAPPRTEAEIAARPDPVWAEKYAYDWAVPEECSSYRVILASRAFVQHPKLGLGVMAVCADSSTRFLPVAPGVEVQGVSTAGLTGFGDDLLPAVTNPDAAGAEDREGADGGAEPPDNIFDDHGDGEPGSALLPGKGDARRAFVK